MEECTCFFAVWRILPSSEVSPDTQPSTPSTPKKKKKKAKVFGEKFLPGMISTQERKTYIGGFKTTPKNPSLWKVAQKKPRKQTKGEWNSICVCVDDWHNANELLLQSFASKLCFFIFRCEVEVGGGWVWVEGNEANGKCFSMEKGRVFYVLQVWLGLVLWMRMGVFQFHLFCARIDVNCCWMNVSLGKSFEE